MDAMAGSGAIRAKRIAVIGAGVSGIAAAKAFDERGHAVTVFERSGDLGGVWEPARSYPEVQTQSPKDLYRFTDTPMPASYPEWPKGPDVHRYLAAYAAGHGVTPLIRFHTTVGAMTREAPGWSLDLVTADGPRRERYDVVAVATGQFSERRVPEFPGADAFGGAIVHSSEYTDGAMARGRDVVVLGFSKSATDVAVNAVRSGARKVTIVYREAVWRVPYFIGGVVNFKRILYIRAQERMFPSWQLSPGARFAHAVARPFVWANFRALEALLTVQLKLRKTKLRPTAPIEKGINCAVPIATPGFVEMVADGRISAVKETFARYEPGAVVLSGGERVPAELAVLATGWRLGVPFLPDEDRGKLVDPDGQYRLYRLIVSPDIPDLGFIGFNSSFCTVLSAELAANWLVRYLDGVLARQPSDAEMRANIEAMLHWRRVERPAAGVYGGLCVAPYHFKHFDELVADIGATVRRRHPVAENLLPPDADAYGRYLRSAPQYVAA